MPGPRDHPGMLELTSLLLGAGLVFGPPISDPEPSEPAEQVLRIVEPQPEQPAPEAAEAEPIELAEAEPIEFATEPPPPTLEPSPPPSIRGIDSKRPAPGTGLLALGSMGVVVGSGLIVTAMAGPGWFDLSRRNAVIAGGLAVPIAVGSAVMLAVGSKSTRRFRDWSSRNKLTPPETGNGLIMLGTFMTLGFAGTTAYATQWALTQPTQQRSDWAPTALAGGATVAGMLLLTAGMLRRSKFASWEQHAYAMPGAMALEHGGGVSVSGRF